MVSSERISRRDVSLSFMYYHYLDNGRPVFLYGNNHPDSAISSKSARHSSCGSSQVGRLVSYTLCPYGRPILHEPVFFN
ncbi:hypothetical protein Hanom_Chr10g00960431 [Helianthus anomalus]